jgi:NB-ARC domain/Trypsin-like peptidase domain
MIGPFRNRVVQIRVDHGSSHYTHGSGFRVGGHFVLTAAHVVSENWTISVCVPDEVKDWYQAELVDGGFVDPEVVDMAFLALPEELSTVESVSVAIVDQDGPVPYPIEGCWSVGYPEFQKLKKNGGVSVRDTVEVLGVVPPAENLHTGLLSLRVNTTPQSLPPEDQALNDSVWTGMSGAAVFAGEQLIGVITEHAPRRGNSTISVTPLRHINKLDTDEARRSWWKRLDVDAADFDLLPRLPSPTEQPTLNAAQARRLSRPPPCPSGFVGRDELISRVEKALCSGKSVGLRGLGGVGKTSVAACVAKHVKSRFAAVQWVKLGKLPDLGTRAIVERCAAILGECNVDAYPPRLSTAPSDEELDEWRRFLSGVAEDLGGLLVVFDDFWLGKVAEDTVKALRLGAPSVMVVTGRDVALVTRNVPGGSNEEVLPLKEDAALRLLLSQIGDLPVPDELPPQLHDDFCALVRLIGGLPIAVVILAGFLRGKWQPRSEPELQKLLVTLADRRTRLEEKNVTPESELAASIGAVVQVSVDALTGDDDRTKDDARLVLAGLSVLQPEPASFTEPVMVDLAVALALDKPPDRKARAEAAIEKLTGASLLSVVADGGGVKGGFNRSWRHNAPRSASRRLRSASAN